MDFKDEYKNEMQNISPTEEQCERIRSGVMRKLSENATIKRKKPLYLRVAAISGAAVCAAAVAIVIFAGTHSAFYISGSNNMVASPTAPGDGLAGGAMAEGSISNGAHSSVPGAAPEMSISDTDSTKNDNAYHEGSTYESLPSQGYAPDNSDSIDKPLTGSGAANPYLTFSGNKGSCVVTIDGATHTYYISDDHIAGFYSEEKVVAADSDLDTELFVQFDENIMTVFLKDGSVFGVYIK